MSDDEALAREIAAVREASRSGEIVAVTPDDGRSLAYHMTRATARGVLWAAIMFASALALALLL